MYCKIEVWYPEPNTNRTRGMSKVHKQVAGRPDCPCPQHPNSCTHAASSSHTYSFLGNLVWPAEGGEKRSHFVYRWVGLVYRYKLKIEAALQPHFGVVLKDSGERKSSQRAELQVVHLVIHFVWKGRWPEARLYVESQAIVISFCSWNGKYSKIKSKKFWDTNSNFTLRSEW